MYKTPGVSIEESAKLPSSIAGVATAIPAFIGYTQITNKADDGTIIPVRINHCWIMSNISERPILFPVMYWFLIR